METSSARLYLKEEFALATKSKSFMSTGKNTAITAYYSMSDILIIIIIMIKLLAGATSYCAH